MTNKLFKQFVYGASAIYMLNNIITENYNKSETKTIFVVRERDKLAIANKKLIGAFNS